MKGGRGAGRRKEASPHPRKKRRKIEKRRGRFYPMYKFCKKVKQQQPDAYINDICMSFYIVKG